MSNSHAVSDSDLSTVQTRPEPFTGFEAAFVSADAPPPGKLYVRDRRGEHVLVGGVANPFEGTTKALQSRETMPSREMQEEMQEEFKRRNTLTAKPRGGIEVSLEALETTLKSAEDALTDLQETLVPVLIGPSRSGESNEKAAGDQEASGLALRLSIVVSRLRSLERGLVSLNGRIDL